MYGATKSALERLTAGLAAERLDDGIAVNSLAPVAAVRTPGAEAHIGDVLDATRTSSSRSSGSPTPPSRSRPVTRRRHAAGSSTRDRSSTRSDGAAEEEVGDLSGAKILMTGTTGQVAFPLRR